MKKKLIIIISIIALYFVILAFLSLDPNIKINEKNTECFPLLNYEEKKGIKILEIKSCTDYEAGKFHGEQLKKEILEMKNYLKNEMLLKGKDKYLGYPAYSILQNKAKGFIKYIPRENLEEMQGIADGAGVKFNDILLINTYDDMLQIASSSSMIVPKKQDFNEYFVHTRNLDYPIKILAKNKVVLKYDTHISVGFPGYIGVLTGIGNKGISLSNHTAYSINKGEFGIPSGLLYRKVLINSENIQEAQEILENNNRTISNNLMIGDYKKNNGIVAEFDSKNISYRDFEKDNILVSTNHFRTDVMKKVTINSEGTRYKQYFEKIGELNKIKNSDLQKILSHYEENTYWDTIANNGTIQSVIMIPELNKIFVANGEEIPVSNGKYVEIDY